MESISTLDRELSVFEGTLDSIPAQIAARECYDEYFEIYQHSSLGHSPFALVAVHEPEDMGHCDPFDLYFERFMSAGVLKYSGIDFERFLKLPRDRAEAILKRCDELSSKEERSISTLMDGIGG